MRNPVWDAYLLRQGFQLGKQIGRGAYGRVFEARQPSLNRRVAVKFFSGGLLEDAAQQKRFEREALLLARVEHPSVPYVITRGTVEDGTPYLVTQIVDGGVRRSVIL